MIDPSNASKPVVIFDLLGVLVEVDGGSSIPAALFGPPDCDTNHPWHQLERGELTLMACLDALRRDGGSAPTRPPPAFRLNRRALRLAEHLRAQGFELAICSNIAAEMQPLWWSLYPWASLFSEITLSYQVGVRKPTPRILEIVFERLGRRERERGLLIDDRRANLDAAEALGLDVVLATDDTDAWTAAVCTVLRVEPIEFARD